MLKVGELARITSSTDALEGVRRTTARLGWMVERITRCHACRKVAVLEGDESGQRRDVANVKVAVLVDIAKDTIVRVRARITCRQPSRECHRIPSVLSQQPTS